MLPGFLWVGCVLRFCGEFCEGFCFECSVFWVSAVVMVVFVGFCAGMGCFWLVMSVRIVCLALRDGVFVG